MQKLSNPKMRYVIKMRLNSLLKRIFVLFIFTYCICLFLGVVAYADPVTVPVPSINVDVGTAQTPQETTSTIQVMVILAVLTLAPSLIIILTSFTRIIISLHFLRSALGTQQIPPNQVLIGLALFLSLLIMSPYIAQINDNAFVPYSNGEISQEEFFTEAVDPLREFMFKQVEEKDLVLFTELAGIENEYQYKEDIPNRVLIPAFILGELTKGFKIGFIIYIPFIVIDMVVASTLMAMGMMMLPPALISAPFKILLFIMVDGWGLVVGNLVKTFM